MWTLDRLALMFLISVNLFCVLESWGIWDIWSLCQGILVVACSWCFYKTFEKS